MVDYTEIDDDELDPDAPITSLIGYRLRDNVLAIISGATDAPPILDDAFPTFAVGTVELINVWGTDNEQSRDYGYTGSAAGVAWNSELVWHAMKAGALRISITLRAQFGADSAKLRILVNGATAATITTTSTTYITDTYDLAYAKGYRIELQVGPAYTFGSGGGSATMDFKNLKLLADQRGVFRI